MMYKRGDVIHRADPITFAVSDSFRGKYCDYCLKSNEEVPFDLNNIEAHVKEYRKLKRCSQCFELSFCDKICQKKAWVKFHKLECLRLKNNPLGHHDLIITRLYMKLRIEGESGRKKLTEKIGNHELTFDGLLTHRERHESDSYFHLALLMQKRVMRRFCPDLFDENVATDIELFEEVFWKCTTNLSIIRNFSMEETGYGLYISAPFFKHSCDPNAIKSVSGKTWSVRAAKDIEVSDAANITLCYFASWKTKEERTEYLQTSFALQCSCHFCLNDSKEKEAEEILDKKKAKTNGVVILSKDYYQKRKSNEKKSVDLYEMRMLLKESERILNLQENVLGKYHIYRLRILEFYSSDLSISDDFPKRINVALELIDLYKFYYGEISVPYGTLMCNLGTLYRNLEDFENACSYFKKANVVFSLTHDEDHFLCLSSKHFVKSNVSCQPRDKCFQLHCVN